MPTTVNGIGSRYVGKKNVENFPGVCQSCGWQGQLQNYETGLWFTVIYIPLLPLGRKQILNYCPSCSRHHALPWTEWEKLKEQAVRRDMEAMSQNPDDYAAALKFFSTLVGFRKQAEAADLASILQNRFGNHADVQLELGSWHESLGRAEQALGCFRRALELAPDNRVAKRAVAFCLIREGRLAEAIRVLESSPPLTPEHDPSLYVMLARGFQDQHQHEEALQWFSHVLAVAPHAGREKAFRKLVRTSERQTNQAASMLPHESFFRSPAFVVPVILLLAAGVLGFTNYYVSQNRTLHVVNGLTVPVEVQLDDQTPMTVGALGQSRLKLPEGHHAAIVSAGGKELEKTEFDVSAGLFGRFFKKPVYVLNAGGSAMLDWEKVIYAARPTIIKDAGEYRLHYGQPFITYDDVNYIFEKFPETIQLKKHETIAKTRVGLPAFEPHRIFNILSGLADPHRQLNFAEVHLKTAPDDSQLVRQYGQAGIAFQQTQRCREFLQTRLADRPVRIEWHRAYQDLCRGEVPEEKLAQEYRRAVAQDKNNSALLYLAGRVEPRPDEALQWYDRALAADKENAYAWIGRANQLGFRCEFPQALESALMAHRLMPEDSDVRRGWNMLLMATGNYAAAEKEAHEYLLQHPLNLESQLNLLEALGAQGKLAEAEQAHVEYENTAQIQPADSQLDLLIQRSRLALWYLQQKHTELLDRSNLADDFDYLQQVAFAANLELDRLADAEQSLKGIAGAQRGLGPLLLSFTWMKRGEEKFAEDWWNKAIEQLATGSRGEHAAADLLKDPELAHCEDVRPLELDPLGKSVILLALAQRNADERTQLLDLAEKLNFRWSLPHYFLQREIASLRKKN
jgi:tetratricopeptide (TPR) repeat protein